MTSPPVVGMMHALSARGGLRPNVLFVDEGIQLTRVHAAAEALGVRWNVVVAEGAEEAMWRLETQAFDVVVSGLTPGVGADVLVHARRVCPAAARIQLARSDRPVGVAVRAAHQVVVRPWDAATLEMVVDRVAGGPGLIADARVRALIGDVTTLPSFPSSVRALLGMLERPDISVAEVVGVIARDPAMTAKTLQLANSAFFGLPRRVSAVEQAVIYLGMNTLRIGLLTAEALRALEVPHDERVGDVRRVGTLSATLVRAICGRRADDATCAALLVDVGRLVLISRVGAEYRRLETEAKERGVPLTDVEREVWGATHAQIGGWLLMLWGLPPAIAEAVSFSHTPFPHPQRGLDARAVTFLASSLAEEALHPVVAPFEPSWAEAVDASERLVDWRAEAQRATETAVAAA